MAKGFFITGTDTDVGKTMVALGLMAAFQKQGLTVAAMKPVSAGCKKTPAGLRNEDAVRLIAQASIDLPMNWPIPMPSNRPSPRILPQKNPVSPYRFNPW